MVEVCCVARCLRDLKSGLTVVWPLVVSRSRVEGTLCIGIGLVNVVVESCWESSPLLGWAPRRLEAPLSRLSVVLVLYCDKRCSDSRRLGVQLASHDATGTLEPTVCTCRASGSS